MSIVIVRDCTSANLGRLPPGPAAGYTTGSDGVRWTADQFAARPGAVRIDQTPASTQWDDTADADDYERGAVTLAELAPRAKARKAAFTAGKRPGQRQPAVYMSASNVHDVANALVNGGVKDGVGLWVAAWSESEAQAMEQVESARGPFPIIGVQYASRPFWDTSSFSKAWLDDVSVKPGTPHRHLTVAGDTVASLAASRGMTPAGFVALQERLGGKGAAAVLSSGKLPAGIAWLSVNA